VSPYGIVTGDFWTGPTGKAIRAAGGKDAQILALYLMSAHHATMIGLYRLSFHAIVEESGLTDEEVTIGFAALEHVHFASFDTETEHVWVREMAKYRLNLTGAPLAKKDKRLVGAQRLFDSLLPNPYLIPFYERYRIELRLTRPPKSRLLPLQRTFEGASKPLGSPNKHRTEEGASKGLARGFEGASAIGATSTRIKGSSGSEDLSSTYRDQKVQPGVVEGIGDPARANPPGKNFIDVAEAGKSHRLRSSESSQTAARSRALPSTLRSHLCSGRFACGVHRALRNGARGGRTPA